MFCIVMGFIGPVFVFGHLSAILILLLVGEVLYKDEHVLVSGLCENLNESYSVLHHLQFTFVYILVRFLLPVNICLILPLLLFVLSILCPAIYNFVDILEVH